MTARGKDAKIKRGDFFLYTVYNQFFRGGGGAAIYNTRINFNVAIITEKTPRGVLYFSAMYLNNSII